MRSRVKELGQKQYWDQFPSAPDFVVMFVPNEACLGAAFEYDPELLEYAIEKKVLISSPVTLLALLRAVAYGWQQHQITENAVEDRGGRARTLRTARRPSSSTSASSANRSKRSFGGTTAPVGSFDRRLMPAARRFQELGLSGKEELEAPREIDLVPSLPASAETRRRASEDADAADSRADVGAVR